MSVVYGAVDRYWSRLFVAIHVVGASEKWGSVSFPPHVTMSGDDHDHDHDDKDEAGAFCFNPRLTLLRNGSVPSPPGVVSCPQQSVPSRRHLTGKHNSTGARPGG